MQPSIIPILDLLIRILGFGWPDPAGSVRVVY